ncbi:hypothetical protein P154DRAFT_484672 [Amniculicola lignicola CBS 123094]|uniref:Uncharacterized protein n=1 Tax=Amniculicola lignicola CBS 123094 TaxID=1392246 RepID=A0A6A5WU68_9PLEO|nr:hypothetical protein P154DRAFT_484672 [Amniculicola lignicola CBS 123094]
MSDNVYNGFWVNWDHGRTRGATLTLPTWKGLVLVSFLTLFVTVAGACFWRVVCFILHQFRSTTVSRDGLFHQQQAILRNSITAPNALWSLIWSSWRWRGRVKSPFWNTFPLLFVTGLHIAFFAAAGLLASQVTTTKAGQALVKSGKCGFPVEISNPRDAESLKLDEQTLLVFNSEVLLGRQSVTKSATYVRTCYNDDLNKDAAACNIYVQPHLVGVNASAVSNATCPFGEGVCAGKVVRYDSGLVHSTTDLGINFPEADSLSFRRTTTCTPVNTKNYTSKWQNVTDSLHGGTTKAKFYEFGKAKDGCDETKNITPNGTFCFTENQKSTFQETYNVQTQTSYDTNTTASDFFPVSDFSVPNADVTIISLTNRALYTGTSSDMFFRAEEQSTENSALYTASDDMTFLGCTEQYQFCTRTGDPENDKCTALSGLYGVQKAIEKGDLGLNPRQTAVYKLLWKSAWAMVLQWAFQLQGKNLLLANDWVFTARSQMSSALPSDQWETEAFNLHNLGLAVFQRRVNEYARPEDFQIKPGLSSHQQINSPTDPNMQELCGIQKILSSDHYNVSVLGMAIILAVGSLLILMDWFIVQQIFWFRSITHHRMAKKMDWTSLGMLRLHQMALEARGVGPWDIRDWATPALAEKSRAFVNPLGYKAGDMGGDGTGYMGAGYHAVPMHGKIKSGDVEMQTVSGKGDDRRY